MKLTHLMLSTFVVPLLFGCSEMALDSANHDSYKPSVVNQPTLTTPTEEPSEPTEVNEMAYYRVLQVLENGDALVFKCKNSSESQCKDYFDFDSSEVGYIPRTMDSMMYDSKIIALKNPRVINTFRYRTKGGDDKTVPILVGDRTE